MREALRSTRVLELGVGQGGPHLLSVSEQYYAIDNNEYTRVDLKSLQDLHPHIRVIKASAEHLPFADKVFSRLEIRLPFWSLLGKGLQPRQQMDSGFNMQTLFLKFLHPFRESPKAERSGWYQEFARVLKDKGKLIIWGDSLVNEKMIAASSTPHFSLEVVRGLTTDEIRKMGTAFALNMMEDYGLKKTSLIPEVKQITLKKIASNPRC